MTAIIAITVGIVFGSGIALMVQRDVLKLAVGTALVSNGAVLLLVSAAFGPYGAPLLERYAPEQMADPVAQALALTAVVIGFGTSVFLLRLLLELEHTHDTLDARSLVAAEVELDEEKGENPEEIRRLSEEMGEGRGRHTVHGEESK